MSKWPHGAVGGVFFMVTFDLEKPEPAFAPRNLGDS